MQGPIKISAEERKRLDRQRFIGLETQRKLLNSRILITPANGPNTQLAKNLILAGVNVTLYDNDVATQDDFQTNFLVGLLDVGQKRGQVIFDRLKHMNPSGNNQYFQQNLNVKELSVQFFERFTIICTSFTDFLTVSQWDKITKKSTKPYYNIFCAGMSACCYISLGDKYIYRQPSTKKDRKQFLVNSLSLTQCLDVQQLKKQKRKQFQVIQAMIMMRQSQKTGLNYDVFNPMKMHDEMLYCMVDLGQDIKDTTNIQFLYNFAKFYGIEYCPVYSIMGSVVSQEIIKVVQNQQQPAMNWIVNNSQQGYTCVLKLKKQQQRITSKYVAIQ